MTACNMPKNINANDIMHNNGQINAENIYIASIYRYTRLELGVYGPYVYRKGAMEGLVHKA